MGPWSRSRQSEALNDLHGVRLVHHTSFEEESSARGKYQHTNRSNYETSDTEKRFEDKYNFKVSQNPSSYDHIQKIWKMRPASLRPVPCNNRGDENLAETIANVLTSIPFILLGIQAPRKRMRNVIYANSLIGVGVASTLYHCSRGEVKKCFRWADYAMIATTTICLSTALRNDNPKMLMAASVMLVDFAKRVASEPDLKKAHNLHTASSVVGGALFIADDIFPNTPYLHAAWHLAAAVGIATCNKLLK